MPRDPTFSVDPPCQRTHVLHIDITYTHLHDAQDAHRTGKPHQEDEYQHGLANKALEPQRPLEGHVPEHLGQLRMRKRKRPKTQVRGCMRNAAEAEFDRVNYLVDHYLTEVMLLLYPPMNNEKKKYR